MSNFNEMITAEPQHSLRESNKVDNFQTSLQKCSMLEVDLECLGNQN